MTPTERTLKLLREAGYEVGVVERFLKTGHRFGGIRKDLFGIIDLIAICPASTVGVQSTGEGVAEHDEKIRASKGTRVWLAGDRKLWLVGWRKVKEKPRVGKREVYRPRIREYNLIGGVIVHRELSVEDIRVPHQSAEEAPLAADS